MECHSSLELIRPNHTTRDGRDAVDPDQPLDRRCIYASLCSGLEVGRIRMKSITDKAEVSLDFPEKTYMGSFGRESSYEVKVEPEDVLLRIVRGGEHRRQIALHLHYYLLADIISEIGEGLAEHQFLDHAYLDALQRSADVLTKGLKKRAKRQQSKRV